MRASLLAMCSPLVVVERDGKAAIVRLAAVFRKNM
jgi:hypothetical protein